MPKVNGKFVLLFNAQIAKLKQKAKPTSKFTFAYKAKRKTIPFDGFGPSKLPPGVRGIGFTGTQQEVTKLQKRVLKKLIPNLLLNGRAHNELHHGDCINADKIAHLIARSVNAFVVIHPPSNPGKRANCKEARILPAKPYLERNKDIVDSTYALVACPNTMTEELRSGTWSTVRYARKQNKTIFIVLPNGALHSELSKIGE